MRIKQIEILTENSMLRKELGEIKRSVEDMRYETALKNQMDAAYKKPEVEKTPREKVDQALILVGKKRLERAIIERTNKNNNIFYL